MRLNSDHHDLILNFAEKNPQIITNKWVGLGSDQDLKKFWDVLTTQLNSLGYGTLTTNEYKRRLTDWKSKTKSKAIEITKSGSKTGGGPASEIKLSNHESRLLGLMGSKSYEGDSVVELGVKNIPILIKNYQPLVKQNQKLPTPIKRKFVCNPLQSPVFPTPRFQPLQLFPEKKSITQTSSPQKKQKMYYEDFKEIEVLEEAEESLEVSKIIVGTEYTENPDGNYSNDQEVSQEHNYALEETASTKPEAKPSASTRRRNKVLNLSKDIQNMNNESLAVLKSINDNLSNINFNLAKIGDSISKLTDAVCVIIEKNNL